MSQDGHSTVGGSSDGLTAEATVDQLNEMVRELLGHPIDPDDNYFTAGLDSATVVKLHTLMTRRLDVWVPVMGLFRRPTLRRTAAWIVEARAAVARDEAAGRPVTPVTDRAGPSDAQSGAPVPEPARRTTSSRREIRAQIRRDGAGR
jgi:aryl carrier-like protein